MTFRRFTTRSPEFAVTSLALLLPLTVAATEAPAALEAITISATRLRTVDAFDVPASISTVALDAANSRADVNMAEVLSGLPGVAALDRQNYAQDMQLSIRGFGARSTFGVRSLRLYADGIPAAMPDGQGQLSHFNLMGADRVEVLRGPFSALYGNSSGGVVQLWSKPGAVGDSWRLKATGGSWGERTLAAQAAGQVADVGYNVAVSRFNTDGWRDHAAATRDSGNGLFTVALPGAGRLNLVGNYLDLPEAQDPLGVTRAQWDADPRLTTPVATQYDTRKSVRQVQGGAVWEQPLAAGQALRAMVYTGSRQVLQYLALPITTQANALNSGGVVDLDSRYGGGDLRWSWRGGSAAQPFELTAGVNSDKQSQHRQGFENFVGTALGVRGKLRRDEDNTVRNVDEFAQVWWQLAPKVSVLAGVRHSQVTFDSVDNYIVGTNPNDSGGIDYSNTTPVGGVVFEPTAQSRIYFSAGTGFETPTFNELSYRADGAAGLALNLKPATSRNVEAGFKWRDGAGTALELAVFKADTSDELAVARNVGGRSSFQNVADARREGFEMAFETPLSQQLSLQLSFTQVDATFRSAYLICNAVGCTVPNVAVAAGSRIPGVARQQGHAALRWQSGGWNASAELSQMSDIVANDVGTEVAPAYSVGNIEAGRQLTIGRSTLRLFARIDNIADRRYIGSVIVNEGNARFYEPGTGRTVIGGLQWQREP